MKIQQSQPKFNPITITLESREEAEALWLAIREARNTGGVTSAHMAFLINLSNWFSNEARL